jgi:lipoprotein-releasing system permease protein
MTQTGAAVPAKPFGAWERTLAGRYLRAKRKNGGVTVIAIISVIGIALAVFGLIATMSVMNGFRTDLLSKMLGFNGHVYIQGPAINGSGRDAMVSRIRAVPGVIEAVPKVEAQSFAIGPGGSNFSIVRGLTPADVKATRLVSDHIAPGSMKGFGEGEYGGDLILVGKRLAESLGVTAGDEIALIAPSGGSTAMGVTPRRKTYTVGGVFSVGVSEYDQAFIYMPMQQAQLFFGKDGTIDEVEVKVDDPDRLDAIKPDIIRAAGPGVMVQDWRDRNHALFNALQVERTAMLMILSVVVMIAGMNIISGLVMLVKNKTRDVAILRTMGASQAAVLRVFLMIGVTLGALGTGLGLVLSLLFCTFIEPIQQGINRLTGVNTFNADVYMLSHIPARIDWPQVVGIVVFSLIMSAVWALLPAIWASRLDPVEALRYE